MFFRPMTRLWPVDDSEEIERRSHARPNTQAAWIEEDTNWRLLVSCEVFLVINQTRRKRRAMPLLRNVSPWKRALPWWREPVPDFRRTAAR
jgi:hypothetical protein